MTTGVLRGRLVLVALLGIAIYTAVVGVQRAFAVDAHTVQVAHGFTQSSRHFSANSTCFTHLHAYSWNHSLAFYVLTDTVARKMTFYYLDFYNGGTSPSPVYPYPPNAYVWSSDSFIFGSGGGWYHFGNHPDFKGKPFNTYDITLWTGNQMSYSPGGTLTVETKFGLADGAGGTEWGCTAISYLQFDPPN